MFENFENYTRSVLPVRGAIILTSYTNVLDLYLRRLLFFSQFVKDGGGYVQNRENLFARVTPSAYNSTRILSRALDTLRFSAC